MLQRRAGRATQGSAATLEPDVHGALRLVMDLMAIPGRSGQEAAIMERIRRELLAAGAPEAALQHDRAHALSPIAGEVGNLSLKLPGTVRGPRRLLMAHVDTVPLCVGCQPVRRGKFVRSANSKTALGADDRAGATVVLNTALEILRRNLPHPPLTFLWLVQEEVGLHGARFGALNRLGNPKLAFNWDGGPPDKLTIGATGAYRLDIEIFGQASHAGGAPEQGVSAIAIAALAIAQLQRDGWHGDVRKGDSHGTSNVGVIRGGEATNVVTDHVYLRAEVRSHDKKFRKEILRRFEQAFRDAARQVRSVQGRSGRVRIVSRHDYEAFRLPDDAPCVLAAEQAVRRVGLEPIRAVTNGGLDANWTTQRGIPTVTLGCGQRNPHTVDEHLDIGDFQNACRIALRLATASENA